MAVAGAAGVLLLLVSTFTPVVQEKITGYERHSIALIVIALFAGLMVVGALRGARPAMIALAACGVAVLLIALLGDLPDSGETGRLGALYEDARAETGTGFYL